MDGFHRGQDEGFGVKWTKGSCRKSLSIVVSFCCATAEWNGTFAFKHWAIASGMCIMYLIAHKCVNTGGAARWDTRETI